MFSDMQVLSKLNPEKEGRMETPKAVHLNQLWSQNNTTETNWRVLTTAPLSYMSSLVGSLSTLGSLRDIILHTVETAGFRKTGKFWLPLCIWLYDKGTVLRHRWLGRPRKKSIYICS